MAAKTIAAWAGAAAILAGLAVGASAEERIAYKSAKSGTSYYQMGVELANAVKAGTDGEAILTVEESQGSVQNVMEAAVRPGNYVFTAPPALVKTAQEGGGDFADGSDRYGEIRSLFPIPSLTMHFVVREDSGIESFADLEGKTFLIGKGSFGASEAEKYFKLFGLEGKVEISDAELNAAGPALKDGQIDGFATAGSWPAPNVIEAAAGTGIRLLSLSEEQVAETGRTRIVIPAGTYPGVEADTVTTSLAVFAYATTDMDEETAYQLTKAYWEQKEKMAESNAWWQGVGAEMLENGFTQLHPQAAGSDPHVYVESAAFVAGFFQ